MACFGDCAWHCQLGDWWGVLSSESFDKPCHWELVSSLCFVDRGLFSSQFNGLGDGRKRVCNGLNRNAFLLTVVPSPDPSSEGCDDDVSLHVGCFAEVGLVIEGGCVGAPVRPIFFPSPGSLVHDSIFNGFPRRHDVTRENNLSLKWNSFQEFDCSGNIELNVLQNDLLVGELNRLSRNEREATSAIVFASPAIDIVRSGEVRCIC